PFDQLIGRITYQKFALYPLMIASDSEMHTIRLNALNVLAVLLVDSSVAYLTYEYVQRLSHVTLVLMVQLIPQHSLVLVRANQQRDHLSSCQFHVRRRK